MAKDFAGIVRCDRDAQQHQVSCHRKGKDAAMQDVDKRVGQAAGHGQQHDGQDNPTGLWKRSGQRFCGPSKGAAASSSVQQ